MNCDIENLKSNERSKAEKLREESLQERITDVQASLRAQQSQNKMLKNQYEKLMNVVEASAKSTIQHIIFEG